MKTALVLSPFATWPTDVGHRRRTFQTTQMLRDAGYRVTFLLYAFEGGWYWRLQERDYAEMRKQWDDVIVVQAEHSVGLPPREGRFHGLDEWWSADLETQLRGLFRHRHFDLFVVHNVWLSKALSLAPRATTTVLETHDLFWKRRALLDRLGVGHDFYEPEQGPEVYGINRAQVAITIQEKDARELLPLVTSQVVTVPFYDTAVEEDAVALDRRAYLHPDKVTFGFLGSAHLYNIRGMKAVLKALEERVARTFAPVDLVFGGTASQALDTPLSCRKLGRVPTEAGFYDLCDIALAPTFEGTGFKIKVADMLALGVPSLVASHSAIGTSLRGEMVVDTPEEMADAMVRIALTRPPLGSLRRPVAAAQEDLKRRLEMGQANLFRLLQARKPCLIVDLSGFGPECGVMPLISYFSVLRHLPAHAATHVVLRPDVLERVATNLPLGVQAMTREQVEAATAGSMRRVLLDVDGSGAAWFVARPGDTVRSDARWAWLSGRPDAAAAEDSFPLLYPDFTWDPCVAEIRRMRRSLDGVPRMPEGTQKVVFVDWVADGAASPQARLKNTLWLVNAKDPATVEAALLAIAEAPEGSLEVLWACDTGSRLHAVVIEAAAARKQVLTGAMDPIFFGKRPRAIMSTTNDQRLLRGVQGILAMERPPATL